MSLQTVMDAIEQLETLPLSEQVEGLCKLATSAHAHATGPVPILLQGTLCSALLKSLQPCPNLHHVTPPPAAAVAQAWTGASKALELVYTWEDDEVVVSMIEYWSKVSGLLCGSWLHQHQDDDLTSARRGQTPSQPSQQPEQHPSSTPAAGCTTAPDSIQPPKQPELRYLSWLWTLGPAALAAVISQLHQFWALTGINNTQHQQHQRCQQAPTPLLHLLLLFAELHCVCPTDSSSRGSRSSSCSQSPEPVLQLLQLLHNNTTDHAASSLYAALTASEAFSGVCTLLQAAAVLLPAVPCSQRTDTDTTAPASWLQLAGSAGSMLRYGYGWCSFGEAAGAAAANAAAIAEAARQAAAPADCCSSSVQRPSNMESLYDCFMVLLAQQLLAGPTNTSISGSDSNKDSRTGRDASPAADIEDRDQDLQATTTTAPPASAPEAAAVGASATTAAAGGFEGPPGSPASSLSEEAWEGWLESGPAAALAALVATYDRPGPLVRALHVITQQQLMIAENTAAAAAAAAGQPSVGTAQSQQPSKGVAKKAEKAAMSRVLLLVERVYLQQHQLKQQQKEEEGEDMQEAGGEPEGVRVSMAARAAAGVQALLLGLSELLRPAANCSVDWRCAALTSMLTAVEEFMQQHPDDLGLQLWCDASVEGLLYCCSHDPSIQARRAALQLLQHVVLPHRSCTAQALVCCLAERLSDKDSGVATAALELFTQLEVQVLCNVLTAGQWCAALQAALELLTQPSKSGKGAGRQLVGASAAVRDQFVKQLRNLLQQSSGALHQRTSQLGMQSGRVVGVDGCRQLLLLLMAEPALTDKWQTLHETLAAE